MASFDALKWRDLSGRDREAWAAFRAAQPALRSPYFDLGWCDAVDRARGDLQVLRISQDGRGAGFLPFHLGPVGLARPAGVSFGDWHGFIAEPGKRIDAPTALAAGAPAFRFLTAPADDPGLAAYAEDHGAAYGIDLSQGFDAYARPALGAAPKAIANYRRGMRKLEADRVEVRFIFDDTSPSTLQALLALKSDQYRRSGHSDTLKWPWARRLIDALVGTSGEAFGVRLSSLWFDGQLAAAHLGLRSGGVMHHWLPAYAPCFGKYAPGNLLTHEIARQGANEAVIEIDFGPGDYTWKSEFANRRNPFVSGVVHAASFGGGVGALIWKAERRWARLPVGPAARLPRGAVRRLERELQRYAPAPAPEPGLADATAPHSLRLLVGKQPQSRAARNGTGGEAPPLQQLGHGRGVHDP